MNKILLLCSIIFLCSCKTFLINQMLKDPKVENTQTIKMFQDENNFSTKNSLILIGDTSNAESKLFLGFIVDYYIFDKEGNLVKYNGSATCHGTQFRQIVAGNIDSFKVAKNDSINLQKVLSGSYDLQENKVELNQFGETDYYIVSYWQKFLGGKRGYKDNILWMQDLIDNTKSKYKFTYIKINTDLQESWGFEKGKKAKLKTKRKGNNLDLEIINLPFKK